MRLGTYFLPAYPVPADETLDSWIRSTARRGLEARLEKNPLAAGKTREDCFERLEFELDTIIKMGFPGYLRSGGLPFSGARITASRWPGRASGAGCWWYGR